ncbi:MAG: diphosphomevalonate decarboxylase [Flavobacteriaceae bacterium]|nr:diphosphomevalonate decarboxylase [Flavobacteriaceae bacterium]
MSEIFIAKKTINSSVLKGSFVSKAPSNIALVKYWGKKDIQIPTNPSLSFTLNNCFTKTELFFEKKETENDSLDFKIYLDGELKEDFRPKIELFLTRTKKYIPFIKDYIFEIHTHNSFPHSSGIASSASGMAALSVCLMKLEKQINSDISDKYFREKSSFLARIGSGSAARSTHGRVVVWGETQDIEGSSDVYGVKFPYKIHSNFENYQDIVLLVDRGEKQVSSTVGHQLMNGHPYAEIRFVQAKENILKLKEILISGDLKKFVKLVELEALTLHSMMMTSSPYFILMKPNTLQIIEKIWEFRRSTGSDLCFTLDAGANVHLLFPEKEKDVILRFVESDLKVFCDSGKYISDFIGEGCIDKV